MKYKAWFITGCSTGFGRALNLQDLEPESLCIFYNKSIFFITLANGSEASTTNL